MTTRNWIDSKMHSTRSRKSAIVAAIFLLIAIPLLVAGNLSAQTSADSSMPAMPKGKFAVKPFHIVGNIYYVGMNDNAVYLITSPQGHILLDTAYEWSLPYLRKSIEELGFKVKDIKYLINAHAHEDHVGGLAAFKELTGGKVFAMPADAPVIADGGRSDFRSDGKEQWKPVKTDVLLKDGQDVKLGGNTLVAHLTAGHTKGCTTWTTVAEEKGKKYNVIFVCSLGVSAGVPLVNNPKYPTIAEDYTKSFALLKKLPVDIYLASHGSFFNLLDKMKKMEQGGGLEIWIDPDGYKEYVTKQESVFKEQLEKDKAAAK